MKNDSWIDQALHLWPVKVLSVAAAILLYFFTNYLTLETRPVSVPIRYILPSGFTQGDVFPTSARIDLRGVHNQIYSISEDDLQVSADLSQHSTEGLFKAELKIRRLGAVADIDPLEISAQPNEVMVNLDRIAYKDVPIELKLIGRPKAGYELQSQSLTTATVHLGGPRSRLMDIQSVMTDDLDLSVHDADFVQMVRVRSPDPLVKIVNGELVEVRVVIHESIGNELYKGVPISLVGLDPGLVVSQKLPLGSMKVQAVQGILQQIEVAQIRMIIDCSGIKVPGVYTVKIIPEVPTDTVIMQFEPAIIEIKVEALQPERKTP